MVSANISRIVLPLKSAKAALHVPESARPFLARAAQLPSQLFGVFRADHVPVSTISLASFNRLHEPPAAFGVPFDTCASHVPRISGPFPTLAIHMPVSSAVELCSCAAALPKRLVAKQQAQIKYERVVTRVPRLMCAPVSVVGREPALFAHLPDRPFATRIPTRTAFTNL